MNNGYSLSDNDLALTCTIPEWINPTTFRISCLDGFTPNFDYEIYLNHEGYRNFKSVSSVPLPDTVLSFSTGNQ